MFLRQLHLENILSFKNTDVELGPLNVLIGPNAVGKSNLIEVISLLHRFRRLYRKKFFGAAASDNGYGSATVGSPLWPRSNARSSFQVGLKPASWSIGLIFRSRRVGL